MCRYDGNEYERGKQNTLEVLREYIMFTNEERHADGGKYNH